MRDLSGVADRLRMIRGRVSQKNFAAHHGVSLNGYNRYENCERPPGSDLLFSLLDHGFSLDWLLAGVGNPKLSTQKLGLESMSLEKIPADRNYEYTKPDELLFLSSPSASYGTPPVPSDLQALRDALETVQQAMEMSQQKLSVTRQSELVAIVYSMLSKPNNGAEVMRFLHGELASHKPG